MILKQQPVIHQLLFQIIEKLQKNGFFFIRACVCQFFVVSL